MQLQDIQYGLNFTGDKHDQVVRVIATVPVGESTVTLIHVVPDGTPHVSDDSFILPTYPVPRLRRSVPVHAFH